MTRITPDNITNLSDGEVFVFGSNEAGIHGAGAAKTALQWGAIYGKGFGMQGNTFALPTKDHNIKTLDIAKISEYVDQFLLYAKLTKDKTFLVTEIGCGLASFTPEDIAPLFENAISINNVHLPQRFWEVLEKKNKHE